MNHIPNVPAPRDAGLDMPAAWLRDMLQHMAIRMRQEAVSRGDMSEAVCIADALEEWAAGEVEAAHESLDCAAAIRRAGGV